MRASSQRLEGLEHEARQPLYAPEADVEPDTKTPKRTGKAAADQICRDDAVVDEGAEAPKPFLSSGEMRTTTSACCLLPTGTASTAMGAIFTRLRFSRGLSEETKERTGRTNFKQFAPTSWRKVIRT